MATLIVASQAGQDTRKILRTLVDQRGLTPAQDFASAIVDVQNRLRTFPKAYQIRPNLGSSIRVTVIAPYLVLYRYDEIADHVIVLRVVHGHRRITSTLLKKP